MICKKYYKIPDNFKSFKEAGDYYCNSASTEQDLEKSVYYYKKAIEQGENDAKSTLEQIYGDIVYALKEQTLQSMNNTLFNIRDRIETLVRKSNGVDYSNIHLYHRLTHDLSDEWEKLTPKYNNLSKIYDYKIFKMTNFPVLALFQKQTFSTLAVISDLDSFFDENHTLEFIHTNRISEKFKQHDLYDFLFWCKDGIIISNDDSPLTTLESCRTELKQAIISAQNGKEISVNLLKKIFQKAIDALMFLPCINNVNNNFFIVTGVMSKEVKEHIYKSYINKKQPSKNGILPNKEWFKLISGIIKHFVNSMEITIEYNNINNVDYKEAIKAYYEIKKSENNNTAIQGNPKIIFSDDNTLYLHKGNIICERNKHDIEQVTAILCGLNGQEVRLNVSHCKKCNKFFVLYGIYKDYCMRYRGILADVKFLPTGNYSDTNQGNNLESPLHLCGYNVNQRDNLSDNDRHKIIKFCIQNNIMKKGEILRLLTYFIEFNGSNPQNINAVLKWSEDRRFTQDIDINKQNEVELKYVEIYKKNRFIK